MKVTGIETHICDVYRTNWVLVKVLTDEGLHGVGEATLEHRELTVAQAVGELERYLVGRDPHDIEAFWHEAYRDAYWRGGPVLMTALSGVEMALWDIKGKALGVPVFELLGGKYRERVKCYANHWFAEAVTPDDYAKAARHAVGTMGYRALKWDPFEDASLEMDRALFNRSVEVVAAVREAVGPDIELMLDCHGRFNVPTAIAMCRAMAPYELTWIEEPVPPESISALADVRAHSPLPIAAGERGFEPKWFLEAIEKRACDILQPDVSHLGGMAETKRVAHLAHWHALPVAPHNPVGPVMNAMTLHASVALPNFTVFETVSIDVPWRKELVRETLVFERGELLAPTAPGLGVELNEAACARYPYQPFDVPLFDGSINRAGVARGDAVMGNA
jgi:galactonate dehydratase